MTPSTEKIFEMKRKKTGGRTRDDRFAEGDKTTKLLNNDFRFSASSKEEGD